MSGSGSGTASPTGASVLDEIIAAKREEVAARLAAADLVALEGMARRAPRPARGFAASTPGLELHLIAPRRSSAEGAAPWTSVVRPSEPAEVFALIEALIDLADGGTPVLVAIDDVNEIDPNGMSGLERLLRRARDLPLRVIAAGESQALRTSYSPWHVQLRKDGAGVILNPNLELDGDLLGVRFPWRRAISFPVGRGMLVDAGQYDVVQVVGPPA